MYLHFRSAGHARGFVAVISNRLLNRWTESYGEIYVQDGQTIGTLSQRRAIDAPTMTGIVRRLEQNGLVERRHDREDRRVVKVYLTTEGRDIMQYLPDAAMAFNEIMVQGFSEAEQRDMLAKLQKIIANVSAVGPGTGDRFGLLPDFMRL